MTALLLACPEVQQLDLGGAQELDRLGLGASRSPAKHMPLACFTGKVATLMAASPGGLGGLCGLVHVRSILGNINVIVLPEQIAVAKVHEALNADGTLKDAKLQAGVEGLGKGLAEFLKKLKT